MGSQTRSTRLRTLRSVPSSPESLTTSPASLASLEADPAQPMADLILAANEAARSMSEPDLRACARALRLLAQSYEDAADLRLG